MDSVRDGHVDYVLHELEQAGRGVDTAFALSNAMEAVARHHRAKCRITPRQREELLGAVVRAQLSASKHLPKSYRREQIDAGMQALAGQVMVWAETFERTTQRKQHALADLNAYARMFRNDLHNISLTEEVARRAWERRDAQIQDLMPAAG